MAETCNACTLVGELRPVDGNTALCGPCRDLREYGVSVSPLSREALELVLAWRSHPDVYQHFRHQDGPLDWADHLAWFESRNRSCHDFIIEYGGRRVGLVAIDETDAVTIYLGDFAARGEGVATASLTWICDQFEDRTPLVAKIHEENHASRHLFETCGFQLARGNDEWLHYTWDGTTHR